ncbi:uncharacterized protein LOC129976455 [Argiope bruennichi]|uniref:uncharacterized protein LOC129976455 n=1 Tax=Argiope bruennichi TaxID=94029 RepID=UPI00249402E3|nr:uncharacterized protein LOC129976455 [Argiope bruennichi]
MLLKVIIFYASINAIFGDESSNTADPFDKDEIETDQMDEIEDITKEPTPLPSVSISSLQNTETGTDSPSNTALKTVSVNPPRLNIPCNDSKELVVTTNVTAVIIDMNQLNSSNMAYDNSGKLNITGNSVHHGIANGNWVGFTNNEMGYGRPGSFMFMKGSSNFGGNQNLLGFPQRNYGLWKGSPYRGTSNTESVNQDKIFGNAFPITKGISFHGDGFQPYIPGIHEHLRGDIYSADGSEVYAFTGFGFGSEFPTSQVHFVGKWIPIHSPRPNAFSGHTFGNWKSVNYGHMFRNMHPMYISRQHPSNNFEFGKTGNFKGHNFGGNHFMMN